MEKEFCAALKYPLARLALDLKNSRPRGLGMHLEVLVAVLASSRNRVLEKTGCVPVEGQGEKLVIKDCQTMLDRSQATHEYKGSK